MATDGSFWAMYDAYCSRSSERESFVFTMDKITSECSYDSVRSCLSIGPGDGFHEIAFMVKCAANITKFVAVEEDRESAERLKVQLRKRLPDVEGLVIEVDFRSWNGPSDPVDLIQMFHVLYDVYYKDVGERRSLLRKAHDSWLNAGGLLLVLSVGRSSSESQGKAYEIYDRLGSPITPWKDIESDILDVGFIKKHAHEIQFERDFSNPDEAFLRFYQCHVDHPVTLNDVRSAIEQLYPDGKAYEGFETLAVFQKAL